MDSKEIIKPGCFRIFMDKNYLVQQNKKPLLIEVVCIIKAL